MPGENHITMGTLSCASGAIGYGIPCRYRPFSPSDSPWSDTKIIAASTCVIEESRSIVRASRRSVASTALS